VKWRSGARQLAWHTIAGVDGTHAVALRVQISNLFKLLGGVGAAARRARGHLLVQNLIKPG
jgi:hypothetical protein